MAYIQRHMSTQHSKEEMDNQLNWCIFGYIDEKREEKKTGNVPNIKSMDLGNACGIITDFNDNYWVNGRNVYGELCIQENISYISGWKQISYFNDNNISIYKICSSLHSRTFWISNNGEIYATGSNNYGELGLGHSKHCYIPQKCQNLQNVIDIKCGKYHSIALCASLLSDYNNITKIISYLLRECNIRQSLNNSALSAIHKYSSDMTTRVYSTGFNERFDYGQSGLYWKHSFIKQNASNFEWSWIKFDSVQSVNKKNQSDKPDINGDYPRIVSIACGNMFSLFLDDKGRVYSCGYNKDGELGLGDTVTNKELGPTLITYFVKQNIKITKICCGDEHSLGLTDKGKVYSWGNNYSLQCGHARNNNGDNDDYVEFDSYEYELTVSVPRIIKELDRYFIIDIKACKHNSYAKSINNRHFMWGTNGSGQCIASKNNVCPPRVLNNTFRGTTGKEIRDVYLGHRRTYIVCVD